MNMYGDYWQEVPLHITLLANTLHISKVVNFCILVGGGGRKVKYLHIIDDYLLRLSHPIMNEQSLGSASLCYILSGNALVLCQLLKGESVIERHNDLIDVISSEMVATAWYKKFSNWHTRQSASYSDIIEFVWGWRRQQLVSHWEFFLSPSPFELQANDIFNLHFWRFLWQGVNTVESFQVNV